MNTILFFEPRNYRVALEEKGRVRLEWDSGRGWLVPSRQALPEGWFESLRGRISVFDLLRGWKRDIDPAEENPLDWPSFPSGPFLVEVLQI